MSKQRAFLPHEHIRFCYVGQKVWARWKGATGILCTVAAAHGDTARIVNENHGVDMWRDIYNLYPEEIPTE